MWRRPDTCVWNQKNKRTESLKTHQDGTPETLTLMGTIHSSDWILFSATGHANMALTTSMGDWRGRRDSQHGGMRHTKKDRQPHGGQSVIKVLCYSDTELSSEPILWIASRIFRVVFSPGKATPLLYWRILLSLMPANWAKRLALIKSKSSKKEGMS